ncbi:MAG: hypothetical protein JHD16_00865 [Solirubrobacteraceae bacterium]|nr:hypothetical protein [Solirubrobacteraceae bacterium]
MTLDENSDLIAALAPREAEFKPVPAWVGRGEVLLAPTRGGWLVVAPPWAGLHAGESIDAKAEWRVGLFQSQDGDTDLYTDPDVVTTPAFRDLWNQEQLASSHPFLLAVLKSQIQHYDMMLVLAPDDELGDVEMRLSHLRGDWNVLFPDEPWPVEHASIVEPSPPSRLDRAASAIQQIGTTILGSIEFSGPALQAASGSGFFDAADAASPRVRELVFPPYEPDPDPRLIVEILPVEDTVTFIPWTSTTAEMAALKIEGLGVLYVPLFRTRNGCEGNASLHSTSHQFRGRSRLEFEVSVAALALPALEQADPAHLEMSVRAARGHSAATQRWNELADTLPTGGQQSAVASALKHGAS